MQTGARPDDVPGHLPEREQSRDFIPTLPRKPGAKPVTSDAVQKLLDADDARRENLD
jgi:hypothetical protein